MKQSILYIGLDVHKNSIAVALAEEGRENDFAPLEPSVAAWQP